VTFFEDLKKFKVDKHFKGLVIYILVAVFSLIMAFFLTFIHNIIGFTLLAIALVMAVGILPMLLFFIFRFNDKKVLSAIQEYYIHPTEYSKIAIVAKVPKSAVSDSIGRLKRKGLLTQDMIEQTKRPTTDVFVVRTIDCKYCGAPIEMGKNKCSHCNMEITK